MISKRHQIPLSYTYYCLIQFKNPASAFISTESFSQFTIDKVLTMGPTLPSRVRFEQWDPPLPSSIVMCPTYLKWWGSSLQTGHSWSSSKALSSILFLRPCQVPTAAVWALLSFEKKKEEFCYALPTFLNQSDGQLWRQAKCLSFSTSVSHRRQMWAAQETCCFGLAALCSWCQAGINWKLAGTVSVYHTPHSWAASLSLQGS